jgi:V/A-type H+-transporting ATPase subunit A
LKQLVLKIAGSSSSDIPEDKEECQELFTKITGLYKNFNYSPVDATAYKNYKQEIMELSDKYMGI